MSRCGEQLAFMKHLLCIWQHHKRLICIRVFNPYNTAMMVSNSQMRKLRSGEVKQVG